MDTNFVTLHKSTEVLQWLLHKSKSFPNIFRHTLTQRLLDAAFNTVEELTHAIHHSGSTRDKHLRHADAALLMLRLYVKMAWRWKWLSDGQYQHISLQIKEVGRMIGGARKAQPRNKKCAEVKHPKAH